MADRLKAILNKIVDWWKKFTTKQKTLIGSITAVVIVALGILGYVVTRPQMITLTQCEDATEASQVVDLLEGDNISYTTSADGLTFSVNEKDEAAAHILLGSNDISSSGYSIDDVFDGSFSTTESDKSKKYQLYLESKIAKELIETQAYVDDAKVTLSIPDNDGTILSQQQDTYASVLLTLNSDLPEDSASGIAKYVATAVGDDDTDNILIMDSNSNVLFSGGDSTTDTGNASSQMALKQKAESNVKSQVSDVMLGSELYDNVQIGLNLSMDFDEQTETDHEYYVADGQSQGYLDSSSTYNEETSGGAAAVPGTDSNDGTTYVIQDSDNSYSTVEETNYDYLPNEKLTETTKAIGTVVPDESSISVVATQYVIYDEDTMKANGQLDGTTFDEFVAANSDKVQTQVSDDYYTMVSNATGIPTEQITILAYDVPFFQYSDSSGKGISYYLQFVLAAIILLMLGFVVFRSTRSKHDETEIEPELSVESLLESTKATEELEDIGYNEKSETRVLIEKFVDENPEAVANLLRNWLDDDEWE